MFGLAFDQAAVVQVLEGASYDVALDGEAVHQLVLPEPFAGEAQSEDDLLFQQVREVSLGLVALSTIAIAYGGAAFSHVNDSGFWMANRYFGMSVADTLKSWTVMKTTVGLTGSTAVLALSAFVV